MPLIETKGAASAQGFGEFATSAEKLYIESCFSTYLYTGTGSTQTITNGIDLSGKGGLVWIKGRSLAYSHALFDTNRGATKRLVSNATDAESTESQTLTAFNSSGFDLGTTGAVNNNGTTFASWTFRKQPKFFDVVTYTGTGVAGRTVAHNLGSVPGFIIVKSTTTAVNWRVYHRSESSKYASLNSTAAFQTTNAQNVWGNNSTTISPTSTEFTVGTDSALNASGDTYVAYLFAHDAGGFGLSGTDNVISCGSFVGNNSTPVSVTLGWETQWLLVRATDGNNWYMFDTMRGFVASPATSSVSLYPNLSDAEAAWNLVAEPTATGFSFTTNNTATFIYIAIRRGPMKVPTSGTSVYNAEAFTGTGATKAITTLSAPDMAWIRAYKDFTNSNTIQVYDRLRGNGVRLRTGLTNADNTNAVFLQFNNQMLATVGNDSETNGSGALNVAWAFKRAPGFFDVVCYAGTGSNLTVAHNLTVAPQLIIIKNRTNSWSWNVGYNFGVSSYDFLTLDNNDPGTGNSYNSHYTAAPTATQFFLATNVRVNQSSANFVAYLFATVAGVSKVGSYTGSGTTKQIDCGFTGGARFVLIKRTDSTGDWYVYDTARGIVAGNDPYLFLNSTAAEVTTTDYVDTYSAGFELSSTAPAGLNANGGTYIFLAIA